RSYGDWSSDVCSSDLGSLASSTLLVSISAIHKRLQRVPLDNRLWIALMLTKRVEDASDLYLPLMYWYAVEPLVPHDVRGAIHLRSEERRVGKGDRPGL